MADETKAAAEAIIAKCDGMKDVETHIIYHASVLLYLVCHMAKHVDQTETGIRSLYSKWADMAVAEFRSPHLGKPLRRH